MIGPAYHVFSGSGTNLIQFVGAYEVVSTVYTPKGFGGSSGGGVVALALAMGMGHKETEALIKKFLGRGTLALLDLPSPFDVFDNYTKTTGDFGVFKGKSLRGFLGEAFGKKKLSDLKYPCRVSVGSLWTRQSQIISRASHPDALVADLARCTIAIPGVFKPSRLEPDNARTYVDGGTGKNFMVDAFDFDPSAPTIGYRIASKGEGSPSRPDGVTGEIAAIFAIQRGASEDAVSAKLGSRVIDIETKEDGFDFSLTQEDISRRLEEGRDFGRKFVKDVLTVA